ncbi:hypothetical protein ANCCAN_23324 [Ancylostoma caninum]|uniref:Uncharacterized protein n=1 Tax=Ancylostoma caninum TaxID=29170 RepID=A0A368FIU9_ANCCA|nr:hypothetical protein ANCCAN_23324 [Ancylostoma caninum]
MKPLDLLICVFSRHRRKMRLHSISRSSPTVQQPALIVGHLHIPYRCASADRTDPDPYPKDNALPIRI